MHVHLKAAISDMKKGQYFRNILSFCMKENLNLEYQNRMGVNVCSNIWGQNRQTYQFTKDDHIYFKSIQLQPKYKEFV